VIALSAEEVAMARYSLLIIAAVLLAPIGWAIKRLLILLKIKNAAAINPFEIAGFIVLLPVMLFFPALLIFGFLDLLGIIDGHRLVCAWWWAPHCTR
jgi:hypothetical protein